jgi:uncharacterized protein YwgA
MTTYGEVMVYLRNLGLGSGLDTFADRIRIQKIVYILKQFGADFKFGYTWYIRGPYSPSLTRTLFNATNEEIQAVRDPTVEELRILNETRNFLGEDFYSPERMELIASLAYLIKHGLENGLSSKGKIVRFLREQKPQYTPSQIEEVWQRIVKSGRWADYLAGLR